MLSKNPEQNLGLHKSIKQHKCFYNKIGNKKYIYKTIELQIHILEWFLKDHVTLKTGVMAEEKFLKNLPSQE